MFLLPMEEAYINFLAINQKVRSAVAGSWWSAAERRDSRLARLGWGGAGQRRGLGTLFIVGPLSYQPGL